MKTETLTIDQSMAAHPLARAVLNELGGDDDAIQTAMDAARYGADAGFPSFTYYKDTCAFTKKHRRAIRAAVEDMAEQLGEKSAVGLVKGFRCLRDGIEESAIALALYGGHGGEDEEDGVMLVENALAWFALEEVGRALENLTEN